MSISYGLDAYIDLEYSKANIKKILEHGEKLEFIYLASGYNTILTIDTVLERILTRPKDESANLAIKIEDIEVIFSIQNKDNHIAMGIDTCSDTWKKEINDTGYYDIDVARYLRVFLQFCKPFKVLSFEIDIF